MKTYFAFAIADGMVDETCGLSRKPLTLEEVRALVEEGVISGLNPSHTPTIKAMQVKFGLIVEVPTKAPLISLKPGDRLIVMSVRGLGRLEGRHEYTSEEVASATFKFGLWTVEA